MIRNNWHILVVEDDPDGQEVVATILEHMKIPLDVVGNAEEAEEMLFQSNKQFNAIIIDLALPGKDGWELLSQIQANANTANVPCIAVTAHHTSKLREEALTAGFTAYFPKPIDATSFARGLEAVL
jgi:CheY-like chemotaxis protein